MNNLHHSFDEIVGLDPTSDSEIEDMWGEVVVATRVSIAEFERDLGFTDYSDMPFDKELDFN